MKFKDDMKQRWEMGKKQYGNSYKKKDNDQMLREVQEEIVDASNYLIILQSRKLFDLQHYIEILEVMYNHLERLKK